MEIKGTLSTVIEKDDKGTILTERPIILYDVALTGADLNNATPGTDEFGNPLVMLNFTAEGAKKFYNTTAKNINKPIAIVLDKTVISAPNVQSAISGGKAQISGNFSPTEVNSLTIKLNAGALPIPVEIISRKANWPHFRKRFY